MKASRLVSAALGVAVAIGMVWFMHRKEADATERIAKLQGRMSALEAQSPARGESLPLFERIRAAAPPLTQEAAPAPSAAAAPPQTSQSTRVRTEEELSLAYSNEFEGEQIDRAWAIGAERSIGAEVQAHLPQGSTLLGVSCRSRFCRLEVVHESVDKGNEMLMDLFFLERHGPFSHTDQGFRQGEPIHTSDGKLMATIYVGRPGVPMTVDGDD